MKTSIVDGRLLLTEDRRSAGWQLAAVGILTAISVPLAFISTAGEANSILPWLLLSPLLLAVLVALSLGRTILRPPNRFTFDRPANSFLHGTHMVAPLSAIQCVVVEADSASGGFGRRLSILTPEAETELDSALGGVVEIAALEKLAEQLAAYIGVRVVHREAGVMEER